MQGRWQARGGDVVVPVEEAEWWGAALAVVVAALHHPHLLAETQPDTDPRAVATEMRDRLEELRQAVAAAVAQTLPQDSGAGRRCGLCRQGGEIVFSPGHEVADLGWCLELFATAVLEPDGASAGIARGAVAHSASAWSAAIGRAAGTL